MGPSGIGLFELLIILLLVLLVFGGKRLGSLGSDLGAAVRGFRRALSGDRTPPPPVAAPAPPTETDGAGPPPPPAN